MPKNGPLVAVVAAIAVAAVPVGGALAHSRVAAQESAGAAAPLSSATRPPATTPSARPAPKPTSQQPTARPTRAASQLPTSRPRVEPTSTPSTEPTPTPTQLPGPLRRTVDAAKLGRGRAPQLTYLEGREVRGGAAQPVTVPGSGEVRDVAQVGRLILASVEVDNRGTTELLTLDAGKVVRRTPAVSDIVTTADHAAGAYLSDPRGADGGELAGATMYALTSEYGSPKRLDLPGRWNIWLIGYTGGKVFYASSASETAERQLFSWTPGQPKPELISTVPSPTAVSPDGKLAVGLTELVDNGSCSHLIEIATGKRLWRTCEYGISGFTPDGKTVIARDNYGDGYADSMVAALDARTGAALRVWEGIMLDSAAEDDQHLLIRTDQGEESKSALVRCSVPTGGCELATGFTLPKKLISH